MKFFALTIIVIVALLAQIVNCAKFGEPCNYSEQEDSDDLYFEDFDLCDIGKGGTCRNGSCQCVNSTGAIFNERLSECGAPTGSYCDDEGAKLHCLSGNICVANKCECPPKTSALEDGGCTGSRFDFCENDTDCSFEQFLGCHHGICDCQERNRTVYEYLGEAESSKQGCKIRAGATCTNGDQYDVHQLSCVENSICNLVNKNCQCMEGYGPTANGICRKNYGTTCSPGSNECNPNQGLICKSVANRASTCECTEEHSETHYDQDKKACVSYVGEPCGNFPTLIDNYDYNIKIGCVSGAECVDNYLFAGKVCECKTSYAATDGKSCVNDNQV